MYIPVFNADGFDFIFYQLVLILFFITQTCDCLTAAFLTWICLFVFWVVVFSCLFYFVCMWKMCAFFFCFLTLVTAFSNTMYPCIGTTMFGLSSELNIELTCIVCLSVLFNLLCVLIWVVQCCETELFYTFSVGYFNCSNPSNWKTIVQGNYLFHVMGQENCK